MTQQPTYSTLLFDHASSIPDAYFDIDNQDKSVYFSKDYLTALELHNPHVQAFYLVVKVEDLPVAFTIIQVVDFNVSSIQNDLQKLLESATRIARKIHLLPKNNRLKLLVCGNVFVSGEHGVLIADNQPKKKTLKYIVKAINTYAEELKFGNGIAMYVLKDFKESSLPETKKLSELGYSPFKVDPNMVLEISEEWNSFDQYLASLKTKFRVKAKRALTLSQSLRVEEVTSENMEQHLPKMTLLYKKVAAKSDFNLGDFNLSTYIALKEQLGNAYFVKTYWLEDVLVGFMSGIQNHHSLDAHFVGIDYAYNKSYAIYQRMLYDYIAHAISLQVSFLNFGRTASEIKSSVGAVPEPLTIYIRHKKSLANKILKLFLLKIQPTPFHQKHPFKKR